VQPPYITCLDLGRAGAVYTRGWDRVVERTGSKAKAIKRWINTEVIYPPVDGARETLLALSCLDPKDQYPVAMPKAESMAADTGRINARSSTEKRRLGS